MSDEDILVLSRGGVTPCEPAEGKKCDLWSHCAVNRTACSAFAAFTYMPYSRERWAAGRTDTPTRDCYERIFSSVNEKEEDEPHRPGPRRGFRRGPHIPPEERIAKLRALTNASSIAQALRSVGISHSAFLKLCKRDTTLRAFLKALKPT